MYALLVIIVLKVQDFLYHVLPANIAQAGSTTRFHSVPTALRNTTVQAQLRPTLQSYVPPAIIVPAETLLLHISVAAEHAARRDLHSLILALRASIRTEPASPLA